MSGASRFNSSKTGLSTLPNAAPGGQVADLNSTTRNLMVVVTAAGRRTLDVRRKAGCRSERICTGRFRTMGQSSGRGQRDLTL